MKVGCVDRTRHSYVYIVIIDDYRYFSRVDVRRSIVTSGDLYLLSRDEAGNRKNRGQRTEDEGTKHEAALATDGVHQECSDFHEP